MRRLLATFLVLAAAAVASAEDAVQRTFTIEYGGRDEALREDCSRRLSAWWEEIVSPEKVPAGWDEKRLGPWSLVVRTSGSGFMQEKTGLVHVVVQVDSDALPSRIDAADAFAWAVLEGLRSRVEGRAAMQDRDSVQSAKSIPAILGHRIRQYEAERDNIEATHGGPPDQRADALLSRRAEVERDVAETRIQLAVTARKLESVRAAADRAVALERLRRDADALAPMLQAGSAEDQVKSRDEFAALRLKIDDLSKTTPKLDAARETAFQLETERVGLEARSAVLAQERAALDPAIAAARRDVARWGELHRLLDNAAERRRLAEARIDEVEGKAALRGPIFEVIRAPGPPAKEEKKR